MVIKSTFTWSRAKLFFYFQSVLLNPLIIALKVLTLIGDICLDIS